MWVMKTIILIVVAGMLSGCAGASLKSDWKDKRGYSDQDIDAIMNQYSDYNKLMVSAQVSSNAFNSTPQVEARSRMKAIFCACAKKLGDKCREKPDGLAQSEKTLWIKANAVDMAMIGNSTTFETSSMSVIDPTECQ